MSHVWININVWEHFSLPPAMILIIKDFNNIILNILKDNLLSVDKQSWRQVSWCQWKVNPIAAVILITHWCQVQVAAQGLMFPIAASLFEAQQLNKRQNCSWKQMRSDDCTAARADWLNDFFFISSSSSTCCTLTLLLSLSPSLPITSPTPSPFSSVTLYTPKPFPIFYLPFSSGARVPCYVSRFVAASSSPGFSFPRAIVMP